MAIASSVDTHTVSLFGVEREERFSLMSESEGHQVIADLNVKILRNPKEPTNPTNCNIVFSLTGDELKSQTNCQNYLVLSNEQKSIFVDSSGSMIINYDVTLKIDLIQKHSGLL